MLKDFSLGTILYVLISIVFEQTFSVELYLLSLVFAILPDMDFILYLLFRKRFYLVTHRIIHYPLPFVSIGILILIMSPYLGTLFLILILSHFILDTFSATQYPTGIQWLYPFSKKSWYILQGRIFQLTASQQSKQLRKRRVAWDTGIKKRTLLWEVMVRIDALTPSTAILVCLASVALATFLFVS